jgi:adenylate cyclase
MVLKSLTRAITGHERRTLAGHLKRYVSTQAFKEVLHSVDLRLGMHRQEVTVLYADLRGFTPLSEKLEPEEVGTLLNRYYQICTDAIFTNGGTLDKFIGDSVMALFNAPHRRPRHAHDAVAAAFTIQHKLREFRRSGIPLHAGIGINTGPALVGFVGVKQLADYTALGDAVNVAARVTAVAPPDAVGVTAGTYKLVADEVEVGRKSLMVLKGKSAAQSIYWLDY